MAQGWWSSGLPASVACSSAPEIRSLISSCLTKTKINVNVSMQMITVLTLVVLVTDRTMTGTFRAAVLRRIRQVGGSTGEIFHIHIHASAVLAIVFLFNPYVTQPYWSN